MRNARGVLTKVLFVAAQFAIAQAQGSDRILVSAGKTHLIDTAANVERVSVASPEIAEAVPVSSRTLMVNGKAPGETSLIVWLADGTRHEYDVNVRAAAARMQAASEQIEKEFAGAVHLTVDKETVYVTGLVKDLYAAQRAVAIGEAVGKVVNLLHVEAPPRETQILLKVRFANVDRSRSADLGINFIGAPQGFPFTATTGAYSPSRLTGTPPVLSLSDSLNLLLFDPQINVGATLKDLEAKSVLQILAEPNLLAMNGKEASFTAGGEFPFPTLQGGANGVGQITIQFRQFGVQIRFVANITPRGSIRLHVAPEVSSLDYANALNVSGFTIPALNTRRVNTEVELMDRQSFAIAGLLDQRTTEALSRIPGLADIPLLGKLFTSRSLNKTNSELLVIVTPEIVSPVTDAKDLPDVERPLKFLSGPGVSHVPPRTPGIEKTGGAPATPARSELPFQELDSQTHKDQSSSQGGLLDQPSAAPSAAGTGAGAGSDPPAGFSK